MVLSVFLSGTSISSSTGSDQHSPIISMCSQHTQIPCFSGIFTGCLLRTNHTGSIIKFKQILQISDPSLLSGKEIP